MLYIRTDMNKIIATGHVMRCLSIADAARKNGEDTIFIVADDQAACLFRQMGYSYYVMDTKWNDMESELPFMENFIKEKHIKRILIDSYQVTYNYLKQMTEMTETVYMDDLNAFHYPVNGIICYANYWEKFHYSARYENTELYLGLKYAPLRKEFSGCEKKEIRPLVKNLLLMSGGSDPYNILQKILEHIDKSAYEKINVICGIYNTKYEALKKNCSSYKNICIQKAVDDIENYMKQADLAVSAGGTTLYELCATGTPTISYVLADNQLDNVRKFQEDGMIDYAGDIRKEDVVSNIMYLISKNQENKQMRVDKSRQMQNLVDGKGAERIAEILGIRRR